MKVLFALVALFFSLFAAAQHHNISTTNWTKLVPSAAMPKEAKSRHSNNNLDLVRYKDRYYFAFRTAPTHFPSPKTYCYVLSSADFKEWRYEATFYVKSDIREPRFAVLNDTLFFYFFEGARYMFKFDPRHIWMSKSTGDGKWAEKQDVHLDGYVPWRLKTHNGTLYLSAYYGKNLYKNKHNADLRLFVSSNGADFKPISPEPQVTTKGAEEGEFEFDEEGNLWATVRLEGSGAYVVFAHRDSLHRWQTTFTKQKYDSALLFNHRGTMYLVSRRHLKGDATQHEFPNRRQRSRNLVRYSLSKKKTALFRLDKEKREMVHLMDFPSGGDTAFPAIAPIDGKSYHLLNYSSDITKRNKKWLWGQLGKTYIYHTVITFE